jgi:hypothetical protein
MRLCTVWYKHTNITKFKDVLTSVDVGMASKADPCSIVWTTQTELGVNDSIHVDDCAGRPGP